jgi:hypothetical protein
MANLELNFAEPFLSSLPHLQLSRHRVCPTVQVTVGWRQRTWLPTRLGAIWSAVAYGYTVQQLRVRAARNPTSRVHSSNGSILQQLRLQRCVQSFL